MPRNKFNKGSSGKVRSNKGSSTKNTPNRERPDTRFASNSDTYGKSNDISWYSKNPELLASVARVPFPYKPGMQYRFDEYNRWMPGVCALTYVPAFGTAREFTDPLNIAAKELYGRVRSKFSGSLDADAPDLLMYSIALGQIHAALGSCRRIYRLLNTWKSGNYNYPQAVLYAMGYNIRTINELYSKRIEFWGQLNELTHMANKWLVPDDMPLYSRMLWMEENVWADEAIEASQTYITVPWGHFKIADVDLDPATSLQLLKCDYTTWDGPLVHVRNLLDALAQMDESYTIQGYFERAFEGSNWLSSPLCGENETQVVMFDSVALSQIENATIVMKKDPYEAVVPNCSISQNPANGLVISKTYTVTTETSDEFVTTPLNLHVAVPTAADVVEATRMKAVTDGIHTDNGVKYHAFDCGAELIIDCKYVINPANGLVTYQPGSVFDVKLANDTEGTFYNYTYFMEQWPQFAHAPIAEVRFSGGASNGEKLMLMNTCTLATPTDNEIRDIHRVCIYSLFNCFRS